MSIPMLPDELIPDILLLLPVVALLRFRCVSKKWRNLIDSPDFVESHKKAHSMAIFLGPPKAYHISLDSICNHRHAVKLKQLTNPCLGRVSKHNCVVGPCNGLLCIATDDEGVFCLWNPSTAKHFHVPKLPLRHREFILWSWGLGYDSHSDDYKVVCITQSLGVSFALVVWGYSLKSGCWEDFGRFPYSIPSTFERGVFANGALHWVARCSMYGSYVIVAFDIGKSEYHLVPQPETMPNKIRIQCLGVFDGCLHAVFRDPATKASELWVMKEYGVKESWTRLITNAGYASISTPLAYTEAGDLLLWISTNSGPTMTRYEFETRSFITMESFKEEFSHSHPNLRRSLVYVPNLVCPQIAWNSCAAL